MIRVNTRNWTADYQISRYLHSAYQAIRARGIAVVAVTRTMAAGDLMQGAAKELAKYHPDIIGGPDAPVLGEQLAGLVARLRSERPDAMHIVLDVAPAPPGEHGILWLGGPAIPADTEDDAMATAALEWELAGVPYIPHHEPAGDVDLVGLLAADAAADPGRTSWRERADACRDMVIDGLLRFFVKIGHDHTRVRRR